MPEGFHGTSNAHGASVGAFSYLGDRAAGAIKKRGKNKDNKHNRKADFENQAKLMEYGANLKDFHRENEFNDKVKFAGVEAVVANWHNEQAPQHAANMMRAQREAGTYTDDDGNVLGNISGSWKCASGVSGSIGGWKNPKRPAATEDHPHGQGQQMKQHAGPRKVFLGVYKEEGDAPDKEYPLANIPTLTSNNSTLKPGSAQIANVGWTRYNKNNRKFESNVAHKDAYQNQQDVQDQQADDFHNKGQQMSMFDQHANPKI